MEKRLETARAALESRQIAVKEKKLPVLVLFEGFGAAGKGSVLGKIIRNMDPRFFKVETMKSPTEDEKRRPFLYRHFVRIPEAGKFVFFDGGWMDEVVKARAHKELSDAEYREKIESIRRFERQLTDNGYLVMKFFFSISEKEQRKRINALYEDENASWRVGEEDVWQNEHYDRYVDTYDQYMFDTNQSAAPWYLVDSKNKKWAELQILELMIKGIDVALMNSRMAVPIIQNTFALDNIPKLSEIPLADKQLSDEEYRTELKLCQDRLRDLHNEIYRKKIPVIIAYEGWDAAGKGGNIKRIAAALDPRGYEVHPIASPEPHEKARHYLWRFWNRLPKDGHIAIFDRTWYGRVMVERLEGFCSENDWQRAYNEINEFEKELYDWGAVIVKFWVQIDKDVQLERFTYRQNTPEKQWKITDEDWRNRDKWDLYEDAVNEMLQKTNTSFAPWTVLESNDKKYARIKALKTVIAAIEKVTNK
jgi:polyphosphate:AMP phosphotransferase